MLSNLSGVSGIQDALVRTNELLAEVLAELKETNNQRLDLIAAELATLNRTPE